MLLPEVADHEGELRACATRRRVLPSNDVAPRLERSSCSAGLDRWTSSGPAPDAARARCASSALTEAMRLGVRCVSTTVRTSFRATTDSSARTARSRAPPGSVKQQLHCLWMYGSGPGQEGAGTVVHCEHPPKSSAKASSGTSINMLSLPSCARANVSDSLASVSCKQTA